LRPFAWLYPFSFFFFPSNVSLNLQKARRQSVLPPLSFPQGVFPPPPVFPLLKTQSAALWVIWLVDPFFPPPVPGPSANAPPLKFESAQGTNLLIAVRFRAPPAGVFISYPSRLLGSPSFSSNLVPKRIAVFLCPRFFFKPGFPVQGNWHEPFYFSVVRPSSFPPMRLGSSITPHPLTHAPTFFFFFGQIPFFPTASLFLHPPQPVFFGR